MFQVADEIVEYIGKSNVPALWHVREVTKTDNQIAQDILDIGKNWLKYQTSNNEPEPVWFYQLRGLPPEDTLIEIATHVINEAIAVKRLALLSPQNGNLPRPYNNPELKNITPDADGLVNIDAFEFSARNFPGLIHDKTVFEILPSIANSINSMYWTSQELFKLKKEMEIFVRLDPLIAQRIEDYSPMGYKMLVYGKQLDWDDIASLKEERHLRFQPDFLKQEDVEWTDLVWTPCDEGIQFICEEIPKLTACKVRGSRYFHGIYAPSKKSFIHCDGAIRIYDISELEQRLQIHVRKAGKMGNRIKIFRIQGDIDTQSWVNLVCPFFVWNYDIQNYFGLGLNLNRN